MEQAVLGLGKRAPTVRSALNLLYRKPIVSAADVAETLEVSTPTANAAINSLIKLNILTEVTGQQRSRIYVFDRYLKLFVS